MQVCLPAADSCREMAELKTGVSADIEAQNTPYMRCIAFLEGNGCSKMAFLSSHHCAYETRTGPSRLPGVTRF